ncbi:MAG TPA: ABC transporter permease [Thermoanaerobaculia bacterium]|jgi:putative ABC transport system permease protein|nr:ABC transporter permease [Thermoanaerobaculia bacterium]
MRFFAQIAALVGFNIRTLPSRKGSAAAAIVGIAGVVAVLVGLLSIAQGFRRTMTIAGSPDTVFVLRTGADSELASILTREEAQIIAEAPGVARKNGKALVSPELFVMVNLPKRSTNTDANVPMRGIEQTAFDVRDEVKIVQGRKFQPGRNEVIVGRAAQLQFAGTDLGSDLLFGPNLWKVVGVFEAEGSISESEIWADAAVLAPAYRRGTSYQNAVVRLASAGNYQTFKDSLMTDPRVSLKIVRETEYYAEQSRSIVGLVNVVAGIITTLMGLAAIFGALNTMYTAVAARSREIATLEAIGFRGAPIVISVLIESILLAVLGGVVGALGAWLAFDGFRAATLNWQTFSQVAFSFDVNGPLLVQGIVWAVVIGVIGGLFPAIRAARLPVAVALRER